MCFVFISEQTVTCATYSINWLVFITQMKSVYSTVRTGALNKAVCASSLKGQRGTDSSMALSFTGCRSRHTVTRSYKIMVWAVGTQSYGAGVVSVPSAVHWAAVGRPASAAGFGRATVGSREHQQYARWMICHHWDTLIFLKMYFGI